MKLGPSDARRCVAWTSQLLSFSPFDADKTRKETTKIAGREGKCSDDADQINGLQCCSRMFVQYHFGIDQYILLYKIKGSLRTHNGTLKLCRARNGWVILR